MIRELENYFVHESDSEAGGRGGLVWSAVKNDFRKNWLIMTEWSSLNNKLLIDARRRPGKGRKCEGFIKLSQYHKQWRVTVTLHSGKVGAIFPNYPNSWE